MSVPTPALETTVCGAFVRLNLLRAEAIDGDDDRMILAAQMVVEVLRQ